MNTRHHTMGEAADAYSSIASHPDRLLDNVTIEWNPEIFEGLGR